MKMQIKQKQQQLPLIPFIGVGIIILLFLFKILPENAEGKGCDSAISVTFECKKVRVESSKDVSHVIIHLQGSSFKLDNLTGRVFEWESDKLIEAVTAKSGCTKIKFNNNGCDVLPVSWSYINLDGRKLSWGTYSEVDNEKFVVYGIGEHLVRDSLGTVLGNGTTLESRDYTFSMSDDYLYAVVKQVDYNGDFEFSKVVVNRSYVRNQMEKDGVKYDIIGRQIDGSIAR